MNLISVRAQLEGIQQQLGKAFLKNSQLYCRFAFTNFCSLNNLDAKFFLFFDTTLVSFA